MNFVLKKTSCTNTEVLFFYLFRKFKRHPEIRECKVHLSQFTHSNCSEDYNLFKLALMESIRYLSQASLNDPWKSKKKLKSSLLSEDKPPFSIREVIILSLGFSRNLMKINTPFLGIHKAVYILQYSDTAQYVGESFSKLLINCFLTRENAIAWLRFNN